jgi:hypothetical protein
MQDNIIHRDYVKTELEYRLNQIQNDLAGRRRRRALTRRTEDGGLVWTRVR